MNFVKNFSRYAKSLFILNFVVLSSCGGGGGGGGASSSGTSAKQLVIDSSNAGVVAEFAISSYESLLELAALGIASTDLSNRAEHMTQSVACDSQGSFVATLNDNDGNHIIGAGDVITFQFSSCYMRVFGATVSGNLAINIKGFSGDFANKNWSLNGTAKINNSLGIVTSSASGAVSGAYEINYQYSSQGDSIAVANSSDPLIIQQDETTNNLATFNVKKSIDRTSATYSISGSFTATQSGDVLPCQLSVPLSGPISASPQSGKLECSGANSTTLQFLPTNNFGGNLYLSHAGDTPQFLFQWSYSSTSDGFLRSPILINQPYGVGASGIVKTGFQITSFAPSRSTNTIFAITPSLEPLYPHQLLQVDPVTGGVIRSLSLTFEPSSVAISKDGAIIYVGYSDSAEIDVIDVNSWAKISQFDLGLDPDSSYYTSPLRTVNISVSPFDPEYLVVATNSQYYSLFRGLFAYKNGVRLPSYANWMSWYGSAYQWGTYRFSLDGSSLIAENTGINNGAMAAFNIGVNGVAANPLAGNTVPYLNNISGDFDLYDARLLDVSGKIYDLNLAAVIGAITFPVGKVGTLSYVSIDPYSEQVYWSDVNGVSQQTDIANLNSASYASTIATANFPDCKLTALNKNQFVCMMQSSLYFIGKNPLFNMLL